MSCECKCHKDFPTQALENKEVYVFVIQRHHSPTVLPIPKSPWDCGMSSGPRVPTETSQSYCPSHPKVPSQSPLGTVGCPQDSRVPTKTSQSYCPSYSTVPRGWWDVLRTMKSCTEKYDINQQLQTCTSCNG